MKVLHIISGGDKGGAKTHMFAMLDELTKLAQVTVVCLMEGVFYQEILERDVRTVLLRQRSRLDLSVCRDIERMVREEGYDIINVHGARANFVAMFLRRGVIGIPIVTTVHSDYLLDFDSPAKKLIFTPLNVLALRHIPYKIAVTDSFRQMLIRRGFRPGDIRTVYNGMDFDEQVAPASREEFAARFSLPMEPGVKYVGIVARLNVVKGVDVFLSAAAKVLERRKDVRFVIAGDGEEEKTLRAQAKSLGIEDRVHFLGFVQEVYDFYHFIDVNTLTSRSESFPYSMLEGARMEKPTVAADVGGVAKLILDGETGFTFPREDAEGCAQGILRLLEDPELAKTMGRALYAHASANYSNRALAENYLRNYRAFIRKYRREKPYDAVLAGYYGYGNFGDDVVLETLISELRARQEDLELLVLSRSPRATALRFGVDCARRFSPLSLRRAMKKSRALLSGGGSLLTDATSRRSLHYYAGLLVYAKHHGLRTALVSGGVGPLRHSGSRNTVRKALGATDLITLRDQDSLDLVRELGFPEARLSADMALLCAAPAGRELDRLAERHGLRRKEYAVVCLRPWKTASPDFREVLAACCDHIAERYGLHVVLLPVQPDQDLRVARAVAQRMKSRRVTVAEDRGGAAQLHGWIAGAGLCLSMRLHPLICAFSAEVPLLGLTYDKKVTEFLREIGEPEPLDVASLDRQRLTSALDELMARPDRSAETRQLREALRDRAALALDAAAELLREGEP